MRLVPRKRTRVTFPTTYAQAPRHSSPVLELAVSHHSSLAGRDEMTSHHTGSAPLTGHPSVPLLHTSPPPIKDALTTETSLNQDDTVQSCLPLLAGAIPGKSTFDYSAHGVPRLDRELHVDFLKEHLECARFMAYDAMRPWIVYWCLTALAILGEDVREYRQRVIDVFTPAQNANGGFGGGHGQLSHCAPSYAVVLSLAMVGGEEALGLVDRRRMWRWLGQVKQADGGFRMSIRGEEDVRGAYCSMVIISLLALPQELPPDAPARAKGMTTFIDGLPEYLSRCQTFEGGISGAPQTEAHGAYAFCALACLCILGSPNQMIPEYLDLPLLISWLSARQYAPEGGFSGRTNKLVDGCYSHWVGGCWPLIEAALPDFQPKVLHKASTLHNREGLIRYILSCCQDDTGGLRDKPTARPDAYHSCYTLAGLSSAQYVSGYAQGTTGQSGYSLEPAFTWSSSAQETGDNNPVYDRDDIVASIHPIFVIPWSAVEEAQKFFTNKTGF